MGKARNRTYQYKIKNPEKCINGGGTITLRSSWELDFAKHCDVLPTVVKWGYEVVKIPYSDPIKSKQSIYIPDFFVTVFDGRGTQDFLFEIKPMHEQLIERARNREDVLSIARNEAKWKAAIQWATRHSAQFEVLNESDLYTGFDNLPKRSRIYRKHSHTESTKPLSKKSKAKASAAPSRTPKPPVKTGISSSKTASINAPKVKFVKKIKKI